MCARQFQVQGFFAEVEQGAAKLNVANSYEWSAFVKCWTPFLKRYVGRLRCSRYERDELVNDILEDAYLAETHRLDGPTSLDSIREHARRTCSEWKRRSRDRERLARVLRLGESYRDPIDSSDDTELRRFVQELLERLPAPQRIAIMRHLADVPDAVVAEELGYAVATVRTLRCTGMKNIQREAQRSERMGFVPVI